MLIQNRHRQYMANAVLTQLQNDLNFLLKKAKCDKAQAHCQEISIKIQNVKEMKSADFTTRPNFKNWDFVPIEDRKNFFVNLPDDRQYILFTKLFSIIQLFLIFEQSTCFIPYHLGRMEYLDSTTKTLSGRQNLEKMVF